MQSSDPDAHWSEQDSQIFIDYGKFYVPARDKHARISTSLLKSVADLGQVVELCCGEGLLSRYILENIQGCQLAAYDISPAMLSKTQEQLSKFVGRFTTHQFDLRTTDWRFLTGVGAFISSLAVHHLNGEEKRRLFHDIYQMLKPGGIFILIDLIMPTRQVGIEIASGEWDVFVQRKVLEEAASDQVFKTFKEEGWNFYDNPTADPIDQPSGLFEQLEWLKLAGFVGVDIFWMDAGHVVLAGWK